MTFPPRFVRPIWLGLTVGGLIWAIWFWVVVGPQGAGYDLIAYWDVRLDDVYGRSFGSLETVGAFRYTPPIAFLMAPLHMIPFNVLLVAWTIVLVVLVAWMSGRWTVAVLGSPALALSIYHANIDVLIAASIVLGMRWPGAWSFAILTKLTPGVGLLWFAVRREWRDLFLAIGVTLAIAIPTMIFAPSLWFEWVRMLGDNVRLGTGNEIPLWIRLAVAAGATIFAAKTDRMWLMALAVAFVQPALGLRSFSVAVAAVALARFGAEKASRRSHSASATHSQPAAVPAPSQ